MDLPSTLYHAAPARIHPLILASGLLPGQASGFVYMAVTPETAVRYAKHRHALETPTEFVVLAIDSRALDPARLQRHLLPVRGEVELNFKYGAPIAPIHLTEHARVVCTRPSESQTVEPLPEDALPSTAWTSSP